jgi:hypothetical protein
MAELMFYRISCLFTKDGLAHPDLPSLTCMRSHSPMESVVRRGARRGLPAQSSIRCGACTHESDPPLALLIAIHHDGS